VREQSAVCVPVPEAEHVLRRWRSIYTRDGQDGMAAHITLLYPFAEPEELPELLDQLQPHFARQTPFRYALREPRRFDGAVLYLAPEPEEPFRRLAEGLHALYPERPPYAGAHAEVVPHCTVVDGQEPAVLVAAEAAVRPHLPIEAVAIEAWLVELVAEGWSVRARLPFGR
jgi:2'-5' RNA ligase